jgi:hypothetical protein
MPTGQRLSPPTEALLHLLSPVLPHRAIRRYSAARSTASRLLARLSVRLTHQLRLAVLLAVPTPRADAPLLLPSTSARLQFLAPARRRPHAPPRGHPLPGRLLQHRCSSWATRLGQPEVLYSAKRRNLAVMTPCVSRRGLSLVRDQSLFARTLLVWWRRGGMSTTLAGHPGAE